MYRSDEEHGFRGASRRRRVGVREDCVGLCAWVFTWDHVSTRAKCWRVPLSGTVCVYSQSPSLSCLPSGLPVLSLNPRPSILCGGWGGGRKDSRECRAHTGTRARCPPPSDVSPWGTMKSHSQKLTGRASCSPDHRGVHTFTQPHSQPHKKL